MAEKYNVDFAVKVLDWLMKQQGGWSEERLEQSRKMGSDFLARGFKGRIKLHQIENRNFSGRHGIIPVRIYRATAQENRPLIVFYHGGGFTLGNLDSYDHMCRKIAGDSQAVVVSVDYRLAPEHKYPVATEDAYDALCESTKIAGEFGANPEKIFVIGDSAGGNLSAVMTLMAQDNQLPSIAGQVLIYPVVDSLNLSPSRIKFEDAPILPKTAIDFFKQMYLNDESEMKEPYCSPLLAESHADLPPALIQVAEYDPLIDEGLGYAEILQAAGVETEMICYPGTAHGFLSIGAFSRGTKKAYADIASFIRKQAG